MRSTLLLSLLTLALAGCGDHGLPPSEDMSRPRRPRPAQMDMAIPDDAQDAGDVHDVRAGSTPQTLCAHYVACGQLDAAQMSACIERNLRHTGWDQDVEIMKGRMEINELQCLDAHQERAL